MGLRPSYVIKRVTEITPEWLKEKNIRGLLLDFDNTITPYHSEDMPEDIVAWLGILKQAGIQFLPYSNARLYRIANFCTRFGLPNPGIAIKPLNIGLAKTLKIMNLPKKNIFLVGDQIFTDCLAGKFAGIRTILVDPVSKREFPATKLMRKLERLAGRSAWKYDQLSLEHKINS